MKKSWLLGSSIFIATLFLTRLGEIQVNADSGSMHNDEKVKAPEPIRYPTYGYIPESPTEQSTQGETLFREANCLQCHSVKNAGGTIGPMLDGIGRKRSPEFLFAHLAQSREAEKSYFRLTGQNRKNYVHPRIDPTNAQALVSFLLTLPEPECGFVLTPHVMSLPANKPKLNLSFKPAPQTKSSIDGKKLFNNKGCVACHSINNVGGWLGPKLDGVGGRLDRDQIVQNISNPAQVSKQEAGDIDVLPQMPKLKLTENEVKQLTDYLLTIPNSKDVE